MTMSDLIWSLDVKLRQPNEIIIGLRLTDYRLNSLIKLWTKPSSESVLFSLHLLAFTCTP